MALLPVTEALKHILETADTLETEDVSLHHALGRTRQALRERKAEEAYEDWIRQQRDRAYVEYRIEDK